MQKGLFWTYFSQLLVTREKHKNSLNICLPYIHARILLTLLTILPYKFCTNYQFIMYVRQRLTTWSHLIRSNLSSASTNRAARLIFWLNVIHLVLHFYVVFISYRFASALNSRSGSSYTNVSILKLRTI